MSQKAFLIWGLMIIQFYVTVMSSVTFLGISKVIDLSEASLYVGLFQLIMPALAFGTLLYVRFKGIGRGKLTLLAFLPFYFLSHIPTTFMVFLYMETIDFTGQAMMPFVNSMTEDGSVKTWAKMKYVLYLAPAHYLGMWALFALLWFGSLDPRKPSKNRIVQFFKTGFRKAATTDTFQNPELVSAL